MSGRQEQPRQLRHLHEAWKAVLLKPLHIFALFILSARVQLTASIPAGFWGLVLLRPWAEGIAGTQSSPARSLRLLSPCFSTRTLHLMQRAVASCPCPPRNPVKGKESMFSSKTNALISQFANMLRCERLTVRQEEQLSRRHSPHCLPCGQRSCRPYGGAVTSPAPDG